MPRNNKNKAKKDLTQMSEAKLKRYLKKKEKRKAKNAMKRGLMGAATTALSLAGVPGANGFVRAGRSFAATAKRAIKSGGNEIATMTKNIRNRGNAQSDIVIENTEFLTTVYSIEGNFVNTVYSINAGSSLFKLLSQIGLNFINYEFEKLEFYYNPAVSTANYSGLQGEIGFNFNYNATDAGYNSKIQFLENSSPVYGKISAKLMLKVDCKKGKDGMFSYKNYYVSNGYAQTSNDNKLYNCGTFQVALMDIPFDTYPTGSVLGEIFVNYRVRLKSMRLYTNIGLSNGFFSTFCPQTGFGNKYLFGDTNSAATIHNTFSPLNNIPCYTIQGNNSTGVQGVLCFPRSMAGLYVRVCWYLSTSGSMVSGSAGIAVATSQMDRSLDWASLTNGSPFGTPADVLLAMPGQFSNFATNFGIFCIDVRINPNPLTPVDPHIRLSCSGDSVSTSVCRAGLLTVTIIPGFSGNIQTDYIGTNVTTLQTVTGGYSGDTLYTYDSGGNLVTTFMDPGTTDIESTSREFEEVKVPDVSFGEPKKTRMNSVGGKSYWS